jgi:Tfp pilus assembly protein PilX
MLRWHVHHRQKGVALLAGLVLMTAISLLALVASNSMILQRSMASNFSDTQRAHQAAEAAISRGEALLLAIPHTSRSPRCQSNCYISPQGDVIYEQSELPAYPEHEDSAWWQDHAQVVDESSRFLIEEIHYDATASEHAAVEAPLLDGIGFYRILGRGVGRGKTTVVVNESILARPWLDGNQSEPGSGEASEFCANFASWFDCGSLSWRQRR